jgi:hypothetical protein
MEAFGVRDGQKIWRDAASGQYYTWDSLHGEVEAFNRRGWHRGSLDPISGKMIKPAVRGRRLNV